MNSEDIQQIKDTLKQQVCPQFRVCSLD